MVYVSSWEKKERRKRKIRAAVRAVALVALAVLAIAICLSALRRRRQETAATWPSETVFPEYAGEAYAEINGNIPFFDAKEKRSREAFENYSELDSLGRCGTAYANICRELMPTEKREGIGQIKPTGWVQNKYAGIVNSNPPYLYNRCHLIAFCLAGENANEKNLITGTRYMNIEGMLPFEEKVASYVDRSGNHVLYRVTPVFEGSNLVASGVLLEAYSVEDDGAGICLCVYCFNVQPGIEIDYRTGENRAL